MERPASNEPSLEQLRALIGTPTPVLDIGIVVGEDGGAYPTVVLDVEDRPDIADLARVHATDGIGDLSTLAVRDDARLLLVAVVTTPVRCAFGIEFELPAHTPVLSDAARNGHLLLATTRPDELGTNPLWLAIDLDGQRLASLL